ncbi:hypothetical protein KGF54_002060 [Candida jiufengensis]|uniref:uncharacterized protein n=1 Tax=Candida jiufengensis TaxID=497108 RepID=UPI0022248D72|nr:uncharacterized protein KGF54_002060 [Candida jiufengensis]KAI5954285.1 hypothetical protein KGF54_002060 [Candida jiufengensis]
MQMLFHKQWFLSFWFISSVIAFDVKDNTVASGAMAFSFGEVRIHSGAYWSVIDNFLSDFAADIYVEENAAMYISSTLPFTSLRISMSSLIKTITNNGIIAFNSAASYTASSYNLAGSSFTNNGEMYLAASGLFPSEVKLTAAKWYNNGLLVFYQNQRTAGEVKLGTTYGTIHNNGQICFHNQVYIQTTSIQGTGCITAEGSSSIYIANSLYPVSTGQTIYLADGESSVIVQALSSPKTYNIHNFGQINGVANKIGLSIPLFASFISNAWDYSSTTGILTLRGAGLLSQYFNIGLGYDESKFEIVTDDGAGLPSTYFGSIQYNGPPPNPGQPDQCITCKAPPLIPGIQPPNITATFTATDFDGKPLLKTGIIEFDTDSLGSFVSKTIFFPTPTIFNKTWTAISGGITNTHSGIVSQSGDYVSTVTTFSTTSSSTSKSSVEIIAANQVLPNVVLKIGGQIESTSISSTSKSSAKPTTSSSSTSKNSPESTTSLPSKSQSSVEIIAASQVSSTTMPKVEVPVVSSTIVSQSTSSTNLVSTSISKSSTITKTSAEAVSSITPDSEDTIATTDLSLKSEKSADIITGLTSTSIHSVESKSNIEVEANVVKPKVEDVVVTKNLSSTMKAFVETKVSTSDIPDDNPKTENPKEQNSIVSQNSSLLSDTTTSQSRSSFIEAVPSSDLSESTTSSLELSSNLSSIKSTVSALLQDFMEPVIDREVGPASDEELEPALDEEVNPFGRALSNDSEGSRSDDQFSPFGRALMKDGNEVRSGIILNSKDLISSVITAEPKIESEVNSQFTGTWTVTKEDGSFETESGIVSQHGSLTTTFTTFTKPQTTEYTTSWVVTRADGSVERISYCYAKWIVVNYL